VKLVEILHFRLSALGAIVPVAVATLAKVAVVGQGNGCQVTLSHPARRGALF
jgi:hypothetical protein